ncbi:hypothetical protein M8J77_003196 [Diaphorina citri]|nr:hypothetical protein M8J77_003196 [Diaphorina citri]
MDIDNATDDVTGNSEATDYQEDHMIAEHCGEDHDENKEGNKMKIDEKKENIEVKVENVVVKVEKHVILDSEMLYDYFDESAPKKQEFCCNFPGCNRIFKRHDGIKKHLLTHGNANKVEVTTLNSDSFNDGEGNALSSGDTFTEDKVTIHFKNTAEEPVTLNTGDTSMEVTGTNKREFPCIFPKCGKTFGRPDRLKKHMLIHDNIRQYVCAILSCGKSYTTAQHLRRHNAAAHGSSPDVFATIHCDQENCFKKFQSKYSMKKHFQKCHISGGRVRYTCDVCIERFFYQADYYAHMYQMHGIKLLKCDKCDLVFTTNTEKNRHMRGHRTWICEEPECYGATFDSRQGKLRLQKWYVAHPDKLKKKITRELITTILARKPKMCSFLEWKDVKIVYKRYASLYFCCAIEQNDNELLTLEIIHRYVELLDKYFGSVCELDIIFNFEKAYFILDELLLGGEIQETSKKNVLKAIAAQDLLQEDEAVEGALREIGLL